MNLAYNVIASASEAIQNLDCRVGLCPPRNDDNGEKKERFD